jgi:hypothetical protein
MKNKLLLLLASGLFIFFCSFIATEWIVFLSHDGTFKMSFPHEPEVLKHVVDSGIIPIRSRLVKYDVGKYKNENQSYQLIYSDYNDTIVNSEFKTKITDTFLKKVIFDIRDNLKGRIISIEDINYKEYPGKHVHITFDSKNALNMKMYLIKSRLYMLRIICDITNDNNPDIDKFFDSFELIDKPVKTNKTKKK